MKRKKSWKSTLFGVLGAAAMFVTDTGIGGPSVQAAAKAVKWGSMAALGTAAADHTRVKRAERIAEEARERAVR